MIKQTLIIIKQDIFMKVPDQAGSIGVIKVNQRRSSMKSGMIKVLTLIKILILLSKQYCCQVLNVTNQQTFIICFTMYFLSRSLIKLEEVKSMK